MLINGTIPANPDTWQESTQSDDQWLPYGNTHTWVDTLYSVSGYRCLKLNFSTPGVKTAIIIPLRLQSAYVYGTKLYLATDGNISPNDLPTMSLASKEIKIGSSTQTITFDNVSISGDYYVYAYTSTAGNNRVEFYFETLRATTSYETFPKINATFYTVENFYSSANVNASIVPTVGKYNPFEFQTAAFHWGLSGSGQFTSIPMSVSTDGESASLHIDGSTLSTGIIQWYVSGRDNYDSDIQSIVYTFNVINSYLVATPVSPKNGFYSNNAPITFEWDVMSLSSNNIRQTDLQYSFDSTSWVDFASVILEDSISPIYIAPANTFPAGIVYWRARVIGARGGVGIWSEPVSFDALGASIVTNLAASAVPFSTVTWMVNGELAYRVMVDNTLFGPYRDPNAMVYTLAEPLSDGEHTIKVQAQNKYGLWSAWAETTVSITNVPGAAVAITGEATSNGAELTITGGEQTDLFLIYRDDANVDRTTARLYKDRTVLGQHQYYVIQAIANGYYTKSNTVNVISTVECPEIALLSGGDFITFGYSDSAYPEISVTRKTNTVKTQYSGAKYPVVETGEQEELSVSFGTFWLAADSAAADQLEAMQGKAVILKCPPNYVIVGVLDNLPVVDFGWKRAYTIYLEQMEWRDYTDES